LRVPKAVWRLALTAVAVLFAGLSAQTARDDSAYLDFACSGIANCNGSIAESPDGNFSTTGITVSEGSGFYPAGSLFTLAFNTGTGAISIIGQGALSGEVFTGLITQTSPMQMGQTTTDVSFVADWPIIPTDIQSFFNTPTGYDSGFAIFLSGSGAVSSADVTITPAPEPAASLLLSIGLVGLGFVMKRKGFAAPPASA
jgi:hypothetical protein